MDKVIKQAELLGEAILETEQYIAMRLAEQAVIGSDEAQQLIQTYTQRKDALQSELSKKPLDRAAIEKAGADVKETETLLTQNPLISAMREKSGDYQDMMQQVNSVLSRIVNGEPEGGCSGSCESCGSDCGH